MKVKLIKCKKSPAQSDGEQVKKRKHFVSNRTCTIKELRNSISVYGIPNHVFYEDYRSITSKSNLHLKDGISERACIDMIDKIYNKVHNPLVKNGQMKYFPDLKISEYIDCFGL